MKARIFTFLIALFAVALTLKAQSPKKCGTMENLAQLKAKDPLLAYKMQQQENTLQNWLKIKPFSKTSSGVITIPVVVHIVYRTASENLSDAQIQSQIDVLNEDFRRLNADSVNTPPAFSSIASDAQIEFCLAQTDPGRNQTIGVTRTNTTETSFGMDDGIKYTSMGGKDAWDATQYLNIWVGNLGSSILGYAQFPGGPVATDGVVINYIAFGKPSVNGTYNLGRTATHEVGHWLNLYHTWGDDGNGCSGTDLVSDTPNQSEYNFGCPSFPLTDGCTTNGDGVMFMNYMDYTDDACMNMFTEGQGARMNAALSTLRTGLLSSSACANTTSMNEVLLESSIGMYPNPSNGTFYIQTSFKNEEPINIKIYNILGEKVQQTSTKASYSKIPINLSNYPNGPYFVQIGLSDKQNIIKKISLLK